MSGTVKKPDERKDELLDIAEKLFMEKGYENTYVKDIYTKANGSFGMFCHHFKSKDEVLEEVRNTIRFFKDLFDKLQVPAFTDEAFGAVEELFSIIRIKREAGEYA
jgi:AcrR family transcriptional regulator